MIIEKNQAFHRLSLRAKRSNLHHYYSLYKHPDTMKNLLGKGRLLREQDVPSLVKKTRDASEQITLLARNDKISLIMTEFVTVKQVFEYITSNRYIGELLLLYYSTIVLILQGDYEFIKVSNVAAHIDQRTIE